MINYCKNVTIVTKKETSYDKNTYRLDVYKRQVLDYFGGFGEVIDFSSLTQTFAYFNKLTHFVMKLIEKLYFIPTVHKKEGPAGGSFRIVYEPIISNRCV